MKKGLIKKMLLLSALLFLLTGASAPDPWAINGLVGGKAPLFTLNDVDGNQVSITDFRGKVILLNFWATWCPPCRDELPVFNKLRSDYKGKKFEVVAVSTDRSLPAIKRFLKKVPLDFIILHDKDIKTARSYKVFSLPTTFLIDRSGRVVEMFLGEMNWTSPELREKIDELL